MNNPIATSTNDRTTVFQCRTESALMMHGVRGEQFAELRATAFKGLARNWLRAALSRHTSVDSLRRLEGGCFGDNHTFGSRVSFSLSLPWRYQDVVVKDRLVNPHKTLDLTMPPTVAQEASAEGGEVSPPKIIALRPPPVRSAIRAGADLSLAISSHQDLSESRAALDAVLASVWLSMFCGGFGSRMRRGMGSLSIEGIHGYNPQLLASLPRTSLSEVAKFYETGVKHALHLVRTYLKEQGQEELQSDAKGPAFDSDIPIYLALLPDGDEQEIRKELMLKLREFKDPAFGLPYRVDGKFVSPEHRREGSRVRHSSPLWISIRKLERGWCAVFTIVPPYPKVSGINPGKLVEFAKSFSGESYEVRVA